MHEVPVGIQGVYVQIPELDRTEDQFVIICFELASGDFIKSEIVYLGQPWDIAACAQRAAVAVARALRQARGAT